MQPDALPTAEPAPESATAELPLADLPAERKKLLYRSWYRGNKEMDNLLGHYAQARIARMDEARMVLYAELLAETDIDLWRWMSRQDPIPARFATLMEDIHAFQQSRFA